MKIIVLAGLAFALAAGCAQKSEQGAAEQNRVEIAVTEKGFEPASVTVDAGKPVTLVVTRETSKTCATELVMPDQGINRPLPLGETVEITFTPEKAGDLHYACAMDMYRGKVVVR